MLLLSLILWTFLFVPLEKHRFNYYNYFINNNAY